MAYYDPVTNTYIEGEKPKGYYQPPAVPPTAPVQYSQPSAVFPSPFAGQVPGAFPNAVETTQQFQRLVGAPGVKGVANVSSQPYTQRAIQVAQGYQGPKVDVPQGVAPIQGLGADYFEAQRKQLTDNLQREFLGPLGKVQSAASEIGAMGTLDSGVGKRLLQEQALTPFALAQADIEKNIFQKQLEERARVEELNSKNELENIANRLQAQNFNAQSANQILDIVSKLQAAESGDALKAAMGNQEIEFKLQDLATRAAQAERGLLSEQEVQKLDNELRAYEIAQTYITNFRNQQIDFLNIPIPKGTDQNNQPYNTAAGVFS